MATPEKEVKVKIKSILGVSSPFAQGGTMRLTIPKRMVKKHDLKGRTAQQYFGYIFVETDKGILLVPLDVPANPGSIGEALGFMDVSGITEEELEILFEE